MLSRRLMLASPILASPLLAILARKAAAQYPSEDAETDTVLLSADGQAAAVQAVNDVVARIRTPDAHLRAEIGPDILDSASRLADRPAAVAAVLPSVSPVYMMQVGLPEHVVYANRSIGQMGVSELHVLASRQVGDLRALAGQQVAVGPKASSTQATAAVWLARSSLQVEPLYLEHAQALTAVLHGQIPAMMLLVPKPAGLFLNLKPSDGVHFLPIGVPPGKPVGLFPTQILPTDYPLLGDQARPVATIGVPLVLACYNWSSLTPMFRGLVRLTDLLIQRGSGLRGFDMMADVPGWERFPPVAAWLARGGPAAGTVMDVVRGQRRSAPEPVDTSRTTTSSRAAPPPETDSAEAPPQPRRPPAGTGLSAAEKERLFRQFLDWRRHQ